MKQTTWKILPVFFLLILNTSYAQDYDYALGARAGITQGIIYKQFFTEERAMSGLVSFRNEGTQLSLISQFHRPIMLDRTKTLYLYFGYGAHVGYYRLTNDVINVNGRKYKQLHFSPVMGFDLNVGLEYHFLSRPITLAVDFKPFFDISIPTFYYGNYYDFGISVFYTF